MLPLHIAIVFGALLAANPSPSGQASVTVDQLRTLVADEAREPDPDIARKIKALKLSERLTSATLQKIEDSQHPGPQTAEALRLLADSSAFLEPPAQEFR